MENSNIVSKVGFVNIHKNAVDNSHHPYWLSTPAGYLGSPFVTCYKTLDAAQRAAHEYIALPHCRCTDPFCPSTSHPF